MLVGLEHYRSVRRMLDDVRLLTRSLRTERTYLAGIRLFIQFGDIKDLDSWIEEARAGRVNAYESYRGFASMLVSNGYSPNSIAAFCTGVKKLLESNGVEVGRRPKIKVYTLSESMLPKRQELKRIVDSCDARQRAAILILASSGLRVGELLRLRMGDIDFDLKPPMIRVRGSEAKERKSRITFMSDEAYEALQAYLDRRRILGHSLDKDSPVIATDRGKPLGYSTLQLILSNAFKPFSEVSRPAKKNSYSLHPHILRKWFKTQLIAAGVPGPIADRLCGHSRYMAEEYELFTEEQLRQWYLRAMPNLRIVTAASSEDELRKQAALEAMRRIAESFGIDPTRIRIERRRNLGVDPSIDEEIELIQAEIRKTISSNNHRRVISENELEGYLDQGWDIQTVLPSGKIVVRKISQT